MHHGDEGVVEGQERDSASSSASGKITSVSQVRLLETRWPRAAVRPGDNLREEEVVELQTERMAALVGAFQKAHCFVEFQRLAGQQRQLAQQPHVQQHEQDRHGRKKRISPIFTCSSGSVTSPASRRSRCVTLAMAIRT